MVLDAELIGLNCRMASKRTQIEFIGSLICGWKTKAAALVVVAAEAEVKVVASAATATTTLLHTLNLDLFIMG